MPADMIGEAVPDKGFVLQQMRVWDSGSAQTQAAWEWWVLRDEPPPRTRGVGIGRSASFGDYDQARTWVDHNPAG